MNRGLAFPLSTARRRRRAVWTIASLTLAALVVGIGWRAAMPAFELRAAKRALGQHNPAAARPHLDRCLARWPSHQEALFLAAQAARRSDAHADAERFLTALEQAAGPNDASELEWTLLGTQQGDFAGEEDRLRGYANRNDADAPAILEALAKGYDVAYRWQEAIATLNRLIEHSPGHVPGFLLRGTIAVRLRQTEAAEKDFRRAVELAPENAAAHAALASLLNRLGHTREAIYHYQVAQSYSPADPATLLGLARALTDAAELAEAERRLDELLAADPNHVNGLVERGRLALRRKRPAEAEPFLARAVRAAPWHRDGHELYLVVLKELGRNESVPTCEARLAELKVEDGIGGRLKLRARDSPSDIGVRWDLWLWSVRNGETEEGLAWLTEILRVSPQNPQAHTALADRFDQAGQPRRAALHRAAAGR